MELQKETLRNLYYFAKMFGTYRNNSYLCSVKSLLLATPLSAGSKTLSTLLHLKSHPYGWLFIFRTSFETHD